MSKGAQEEAMAATYTNGSSGGAGGKEDYPQVIVKGKRTKRMRLLQVLAPAAAVPAPTSSASSSGDLSGSTASTTAATTEEEKDMANCLILLAQGRTEPRLEEEAGHGEGAEKLSERRFPEAATTTTDGKVAGTFAYECKTCNKCFPSFQALGGHRASHKRPKTLHPPAAAAADEKRAIVEEDGLQISLASRPKINTNILPSNGGGRPTPPTTTIPTPTTTTNNNNYSSIAASNSKPRVHECSICGSEFSSGQALGGHMRRHRAPATAPEPHQEAKKERSLLSLDLNLPAPMDDDRGDFPRSPSFAFTGKRPLIFSASLVDCHY